MCKKHKDGEQEIKFTRKQRHALRSYRWRFVRNFFIWLAGVITGLVLVAGTILGVLAFTPVDTFTGGSEEGAVSEKVANQSILSLILSIQNYGFSDFPIVTDLVEDLIDQNGLDQYVEVDIEKLKTLKFNDSNFADKLYNCVTVTASIDSLGLKGMLSDIGELDIFNKWGDAGEVDTTASNFEYKLYYYKSGNKYLKAFSKENGVVTRVAPVGMPLYTANLAQISILDAIDVLGPSFTTLKIGNLLDAFDVSLGKDIDPIFDKILGDKAINELDTIGQGVLLSDIIEVNSDTKQIYDVLCSAVNVPAGTERPTANTISIDYLMNNGLNINNITLESVLPREDNAEIYDIVDKIVKDTNNDNNIQLDELQSIELGSLTLESVLPREDEYGKPINTEIYDILDRVADTDGNKSINLDELMGIQLNTITVEKLLPRTEEVEGVKTPVNVEIYNFLDSLELNKDSNGEIPLSEVMSIKLENVSLEGVLPREENAEIYDLLDKIVKDTNGDNKLQLSELKGITLNSITLESVLPRTKINEDGEEVKINTEIYKILDAAKVDKNGDGIQISELQNLTLSLEVVLPREDELGNKINTEIYNILDGMGADADKNGAIDLNELQNLTIENLTLESVLPREDELGNKINTDIYKILDAAVNAGEDGKIQLSELKTLSLSLETILPREDEQGNKINTEIYDILDNAGVDANGDKLIQLDELKGIKITLESVLPRYKDVDGEQVKINTQIYEILDNAGVDTDKDGLIQLSELQNLKLTLEVLLPRYEGEGENRKPINVDIYNVLDNAGVDKNKNGSIELDELKSLSLTLETILPRKDASGNAINTEIYNILDNAGLDTNKDGAIQLDELKSLSLTLETILPRTEIIDGVETLINQDIYKILDNAGVDVNGDNLIQLDEIKNLSLTLESVLPRYDENGNEINKDIYRILGGADTNNDNKIQFEELQNLQIKDIGNNVFLYELIGENENTKELLDIICKTLEIPEGETRPTSKTLTLSHLSNYKLSLNSIDIETILPRTQEIDGVVTQINVNIYRILDAAVNAGEDGKIQLGELQSINIKDIGNSLYLHELIEITETTQNLFDIVCKALVIPEGETRPNSSNLSVEHLTKYEISLNQIDLESIIPEYTEVDGEQVRSAVYTILENAITDSNKDGKIQIGEFTSINVDNIVLSSVIPHNNANANIYAILADIYVGKNVDTITLGELHEFNTNKLRLGTALPRWAHADLYAIFDSAITLTEEDKKNGLNSIEDITLGTLDSHFYPENIRFKQFAGESDTLEKIFNDAFYNEDDPASSITYDKLTLGQLGDFDITKVHLGSVITEETGNDILDALLAKGTTIGNIGTAINALTLYEIYGVECFEKPTEEELNKADSKYSGKPSYTFDEATRTYTLATDGEVGDYYLTDHAGIWLLLCFDVDYENDIDEYGRPTKYVASETSVVYLQDHSDLLSGKITGATIRQLVDAGILKNENGELDKIMTMNMQKVIEFAGKYADFMQ